MEFGTNARVPNTRVPNRGRINSGLSPQTGTLTEEQSRHLLKRTLFGVRKSDLVSLSGMTAGEAVDSLLQPEQLPSPPINNYNPYANEPDPDVNEGESWVLAPYSNTHEGLRIVSLKSWILDQFLNQSVSIHQKLTLFWHNLLPTEMFGVFRAKTSYKYWEMLSDNAFGNYKQLIKELTLDPSMLLYLNGTFNHKSAPDENYSRELQELFCIGKGPNSGYTESDVQAAARVLTGWVIISDSIFGEGEPYSLFADSVLPPASYWHDESDKQFSEFYGNTVIQGRSGAAGAEELDDMLDMLFDNNETALYICRRLYNFFVYHQIDEATEQNVIVPLAQIFRENNYDILPALSTLFKSQHFFDAANYGAAIKNPVDHEVGFWRTLEIPSKAISPEISPSDRLLLNTVLSYNMEDRGMYIGDPPSVAGWQAYYQEPTFDRIWISSDSYLSRVKAQDDLIWFKYVRGVYLTEFSLIQFAEELTTPTEPNDLIVEAAQLLLGIEPSQEKIDELIPILDPIGEQWIIEWNDYQSDPENETKKQVVETRLQSLFQNLTQLGEFQLM